MQTVARSGFAGGLLALGVYGGLNALFAAGIY